MFRYVLTLPRRIRIQESLGQYDRMRHTSVRINPQVTEGVVEEVLLGLEVCDDVAIELGLQLEPDRLDVDDVVADLQLRRLLGLHRVFLGALLPRLGDHVLERQDRVVLGQPADPALVTAVVYYYGNAAGLQEARVGVNRVWHRFLVFKLQNFHIALIYILMCA